MAKDVKSGGKTGETDMVCILCQEALSEVDVEISALVCTNGKCGRVGLLTVMYGQKEPEGGGEGEDAIRTEDAKESDK